MYMDEAVQSVYDWNLRFGHITGDPVADADRWENDLVCRDLALDLIEEEFRELTDAVISLNKVDTLDAVCDILVTVFGLAAKAGVNQYIPEAFREVMSSNWSKLDADGNPVYYDSGKIAKSDLYYPPNLSEVIEGIDEGVL